MIDVRTAAEWSYVGQPDLASIGKQLRCVEWNTFPDGSRNPHFIEEATTGLDTNQPILLICRSGARSRAAAQALQAAGYESTYNVSAGFEGDLDADGHRRGGWKGAGLPWRQK
jgi:rhodanese-related sulfurtransferase